MAARRSILFTLEDKSITYIIDFATNRVSQLTADNEKQPVSHITMKVIEDGDPDDDPPPDNTTIKYIGFSGYDVKLYITH